MNEFTQRLTTGNPVTSSNRCRTRRAALAATLIPLALTALPVRAGVLKPTVDIGAGLRTSYTHTVNDGAGSKTNDFALNSMRLYVNGSVTSDIKFTFDTEYKHDPGAADNNTVQVIDAIGRFDYSDKFHIWAGRFLPPSDRANSYGPYYADNWAVYYDGVQDDYPSTSVGRDDGVAYWGQFGMVKVSAGEFDVPTTIGTSEVVSAGRVMIDLWDPEPGYYLNGTYYGTKNILALGVAGQTSAARHAYSADLLIERNFPGIGTFSLESEYARNDHFGAYGTVSAASGSSSCDGDCYANNHGYYVLVSYLMPSDIGPGKLQLLGKFGNDAYAGPDATITTLPLAYQQHTGEVDLNYLIKNYDARVTLFFLNQARSGGFADSRTVGLGLQLQM